MCVVSSHIQEFKKVVRTSEKKHGIPTDKHCKACHMFTMLVSNCKQFQRSQNWRTRHNKLKRCGKKGGAGRGHAEKKWAKTPGPGRGQKWTLSSQVSLFSGKNGTLLQQYAIGMRKVSGFALFGIKSHRVCSFSKKCPEGPIREKAGLIPEYPTYITS